MTCDAADTRMSVSGGSIHHHTVGQSVSLECRLEGLTTPPVSLYWERGNKVITANQRPGTVLDTEKLATVSRVTLHLARVELQDTGQSYNQRALRCKLYTVHCTLYMCAGNYTCVSDTHTATLLLVVTVPDTNPEGREIVNTCQDTNQPHGVMMLLYSLPIFYSNKWTV